MSDKPAKGAVLKYRHVGKMVHTQVVVLDHPKFPGISNALIWDVDKLRSGENPILLFNRDRTYYAQLNKFRNCIYRSKKCVGKNKGLKVLADRDVHGKTLKKSPAVQIDFSSCLS